MAEVGPVGAITRGQMKLAFPTGSDSVPAGGNNAKRTSVKRVSRSLPPIRRRYSRAWLRSTPTAWATLHNNSHSRELGLGGRPLNSESGAPGGAVISSRTLADMTKARPLKIGIVDADTVRTRLRTELDRF